MRIIFIFISIFIVVSGCAPLDASTASSIPFNNDHAIEKHFEPFGEIKLGYYTKYSKGDTVAYHSLKKNGDKFNTLSLDNYDLDQTGHIKARFDISNVLKETKAKGINTLALIQNTGFNQEMADSILKNKSLSLTLIMNSLDIVQKNHLNGINIDFENLTNSDRKYYDQFLKALYTTFHSEGYQVVGSVPAKTNDTPHNTWTYPFDYQEIGKYADVVQLMTYDLHGPWSKPGSISSANWMQQTVKYAMGKIPKNKIVIGLPTYAYDWDLKTNKAKGLPMSTISKLMSEYHVKEEWDNKTKSAYIYYTDENKDKHVVWMENDRSIKIKSHYVNKYHIKGLSFWRLGTESESFWTSI